MVERCGTDRRIGVAGVGVGGEGFGESPEVVVAVTGPLVRIQGVQHSGEVAGVVIGVGPVEPGHPSGHTGLGCESVGGCVVGERAGANGSAGAVSGGGELTERVVDGTGNTDRVAGER